ncbi:MAG: adenylyltransferase/cytidyltransferase family protein [Candidatus Acidiferrales bacterium]
MAIVSQSELILQRGEWKRNGKSVVCAAGVFDLLHPGHIRLLEQARGLGDILVVGLQSDASVRSSAQQDAARGGVGDASGGAAAAQRPVTLAMERAEILMALAAVDFVAEFDEPTPRELFARLSPDVVVKGGEAGSQESVFLDDEAVRAAGGRVVRVPLEPGYSTSFLLERISQFHA